MKNTHFGDMADENGYYELQLHPGKYKLLFSAIGYNTKVEDIILQEDTLHLDLYLTSLSIMMPGITIYGSRESLFRQKKSDSRFEIFNDEVQYLPLNLNDMNRSFKTLPGITSNNGKRSEFNVWGGTPEENKVQLNGFNIYRPYHLKEYGNSSISILNMDMIRSADLITGGFPAKYGDVLSSVMDVQFRQGSRDKLKGQMELGVIRSGILLEGPFFKNGSWIVGINKSLLDVAIGLMEKYQLAEKFYEVKESPRFYDIQGKLDYVINQNHMFSFVFITAEDNYQEDPASVNKTSKIEFSRFYTLQNISERNYIQNAYNANCFYGVQYLAKFSNSLISDIKISYQKLKEDFHSIDESEGFGNYYDDNDIKIGTGTLYFEHDWGNNLKQGVFEFKTDVTYKIHTTHELDAGYFWQWNDYLYQEKEHYQYKATGEIELDSDSIQVERKDSFENEIYLDSPGIKHSFYIQDNWNLSNKLFAIFGFRFSYFNFNRNSHVSPRLSLNYTIDASSSLQFAYGEYYQSPRYNEFKIQTPTSHNTKDQHATHYLIGFQHAMNELFRFDIDVYYKSYKNLIPFEYSYASKRSERVNNAIASSKGINFQLKYDLEKVFGWLSYGYLQAKENKINDVLGYYPRSTDQRHSLAFIFNWNIGSKWRVHGKFLYGSGFPYTPIDIYVQNMRLVRGEKNSHYLPAYHRMDLRLSRSFNLNWGVINTYFEIINLTDNENVLGFENYRIDENGHLTKDTISLLPRLPNVGIKIYFN